jgi:hypothetical protein
MSAPGLKAAFVRVPCHVAEVPTAEFQRCQKSRHVEVSLVGHWSVVQSSAGSTIKCGYRSGIPALRSPLLKRASNCTNAALSSGR